MKNPIYQPLYSSKSQRAQTLVYQSLQKDTDTSSPFGIAAICLNAVFNVTNECECARLTQSGPLAVISRDITTPLIGVKNLSYPFMRPSIGETITPFTTSRGPSCSSCRHVTEAATICERSPRFLSRNPSLHVWSPKEIAARIC